jgi:nucleotide-binding universal stress UspA family protein
VSAGEPTFTVCVVPVDFAPVKFSQRDAMSVGSDAAFEVSDATIRALALADRLTAGGTIHLVHATPQLTHFGLARGSEGTWFPQDSAADLDRISKEHALAVLTPLASECKHATVELDIRPGPAADVILKVVELVEADGVVLPLSGHGALKRALLGRTANHLIRRSPCPVLIVPA